MGVFENFPYTNFHDLNLDWILKAVVQQNKTISEFVTGNVLSYADPIQWDITSQYARNTVVISKDGTAYMSIAPVPFGVTLDNTNYWQPIFNFKSIITDLESQIAANEGDKTAASKAYSKGSLIWSNDKLYRALIDIDAGTNFIIGTNVENITVEEAILNQIGSVITRTANTITDTTNETATRTAKNIVDHASGDYTENVGHKTIEAEQITEHSTEDREIDVDGNNSIRVDGANTLNVGGPTTEVYADTFGLTIKKDAAYNYTKLVSATFNEKCMLNFPNRASFNLGNVLTYDDLKEQNYIDVKSFGAKGDGVTDDTAAIQKALDSAASSGCLFFSDGTYLVTATLINKGCSIVGSGAAALKMISSDGAPIIKYDCDAYQYYYKAIFNMHFISDDTANAIEIVSTKTSNNFFSHNIIQGNCFINVKYGIDINKKSDSNGEIHCDWNIFSNNTFRDVSRALSFDLGSGTGNIIADSTIVANEYGILYTGQGNIGDIIISNIHFGGSCKAILIDGTSSTYNERMTITNCQFDAGVTHGVSINTFSLFNVSNCLFGGDTGFELANCSRYTLEYPTAGNKKTYAVTKQFNSGLNKICNINMPDNGIAKITGSYSTTGGSAYKEVVWNTTTHEQTDIINSPTSNNFTFSQESANQIGVYYTGNHNGSIFIEVDSITAIINPPA